MCADGVRGGGDRAGLVHARRIVCAYLIWIIDLAAIPPCSGQPTRVTMTIAQDIVRIVREQPGLTERELAERLFGEEATIQRVNPTCRKLVAMGWLVRRGRGWAADPFTYFAANPSR